MEKPKEVLKGMVKQNLQDLSCSLDGSLDKAIYYLENLKKVYPGFILNLDTIPNDYEEGSHLELVGQRKATTEEVEQWNTYQAEQEKFYKDCERKQYKALKAKFEGAE